MPKPKQKKWSWKLLKRRKKVCWDEFAKKSFAQRRKAAKNFFFSLNLSLLSLRLRVKYIFLFIFFIPCIFLPAQNDSTNHFSKKRFSVVIGTEAALYSGSLLALNQLWYKDYPRRSFHFFDDNNEWLQMDKCGH